MFIIAEYELVCKEESCFLVKSNEKLPGCPHCGGLLKYRDSRLRIRKHEGGSRDYLCIRRFRCSSCGRLHTELPDVLLPYKHYEAEVVSGVLDGYVTPEDPDSEDCPCAGTMLCWLRWFRYNLANIEGYLRNVGYGILNLGEEFLFCGRSLLDGVRSRHASWLERIHRAIYNSGGFLPAFYR